MSDAVEPTAYDILGVAPDVPEPDLRRAYRAQALKVHPDHRPNDPVASQKFHELTEAFELLKDPAKRRALDESIRARLAKNERYKAHNAKRKELVDELEGNERAIKRQRETRKQEHKTEEDELTRIRMESQRLRQARTNARKPPIQSSDSQRTSDAAANPKSRTSQFAGLASRSDGLKPDASVPSSHAGLGDLESATLYRLRRAEREKIEKEIRERDE